LRYFGQSYELGGKFHRPHFLLSGFAELPKKRQVIPNAFCATGTNDPNKIVFEKGNHSTTSKNLAIETIKSAKQPPTPRKALLDSLTPPKGEAARSNRKN
jgi:hypothetical protein